MFKNISNSHDISNYIPIFTASLIVYIIGLIYVYFRKNKKNKIEKKNLDDLYKNFNLSIVLTDILLLVISVNRARFILPYIFKEYSLLKFILIGVVTQLMYDIVLSDLYYLIPRNSSLLFNFFSKENNNDNTSLLKEPIIITNIISTILTILIASFMASFTSHFNINILISITSFIPYLIYLIK
jgi:hypothetical protein